MKFLKQEMIYWLWHRWFGHGAETGYQVFEKKGLLGFQVRVCLSCDRVWPEDVLTAADAMEAEFEPQIVIAPFQPFMVNGSSLMVDDEGNLKTAVPREFDGALSD